MPDDEICQQIFEEDRKIHIFRRPILKAHKHIRKFDEKKFVSDMKILGN
jgi:hypothetical protein